MRHKSFYRHVNQARLQHLLAALDQAVPPVCIDELAIAAGFNSLSAFYKCFRQRTGLSPKAYARPDEVRRVIDREGIDCDYRKGGALYCAARYPEQERSLRAYLDKLYKQGLDERDQRRYLRRGRFLRRYPASRDRDRRMIRHKPTLACGSSVFPQVTAPEH